jgi:hypothetical protein
MKKVKNLIENKDLINTFKKLKTRSYLNKKKLRINDFYYAKFCKNYFFKKKLKRNNLLYLDSSKIFNSHVVINNLLVYNQLWVFKLNLMFIC